MLENEDCLDMISFIGALCKSQLIPEVPVVVQLAQDLRAVWDQVDGNVVDVEDAPELEDRPDDLPFVFQKEHALGEPEMGFAGKQHLNIPGPLCILADGMCLFRCVLAGFNLLQYWQIHTPIGSGISPFIIIRDVTFSDYLLRQCIEDAQRCK